jgi:hypothetical protein
MKKVFLKSDKEYSNEEDIKKKLKIKKIIDEYNNDKVIKKTLSNITVWTIYGAFLFLIIGGAYYLYKDQTQIGDILSNALWFIVGGIVMPTIKQYIKPDKKNDKEEK